jgi:hypothetical protein
MNYYKVCERLSKVTEEVANSTHKVIDLTAMLNICRKINALIVASAFRRGCQQGGEHQHLNRACAELILASRPLGLWKYRPLTTREFTRVIRRLENAWFKHHEEAFLSKEAQP